MEPFYVFEGAAPGASLELCSFGGGAQGKPGGWAASAVKSSFR